MLESLLVTAEKLSLLLFQHLGALIEACAHYLPGKASVVLGLSLASVYALTSEKEHSIRQNDLLGVLVRHLAQDSV